jgi:hypothetical protein
MISAKMGSVDGRCSMVSRRVVFVWPLAIRSCMGGRVSSLGLIVLGAVSSGSVFVPELAALFFCGAIEGCLPELRTRWASLLGSGSQAEMRMEKCSMNQPCMYL